MKPKNCRDCVWCAASSSGPEFDKCAAPKSQWTYCNTERLQGGFAMYATRSCGKRGRWFKQKEQDDDGGHRDAPEEASGGADQTTNPSPGAATAGAGNAAGASGAASSGVMVPGSFLAGVAAQQAAAAHYAGGVVYSKNPLYPTYRPLPEPKIEDAGITVGEIVAWRAWRVRYGFIMSTYVDEAWAPDAPMEGDVAKGVGVHAWKTPHKALSYSMESGSGAQVLVIGKVALWGEVIEHERGYRAQHARPVAFEFIVAGGHANLADEEMLLAELRKRYGL